MDIENRDVSSISFLLFITLIFLGFSFICVGKPWLG